MEKVLWVGKLRAKDMNDVGSENAVRLVDWKARRAGAGDPASGPSPSFRVRPASPAHAPRLPLPGCALRRLIPGHRISLLPGQLAS